MTPQNDHFSIFSRVFDHLIYFFGIFIVRYHRKKCLEEIEGLIFENRPKIHRFAALRKWLNWIENLYSMIFL